MSANAADRIDIELAAIPLAINRGKNLRPARRARFESATSRTRIRKAVVSTRTTPDTFSEYSERFQRLFETTGRRLAQAHESVPRRKVARRISGTLVENNFRERRRPAILDR